MSETGKPPVQTGQQAMQSNHTELDATHMKHALSQFATGITVVTTRTPSGRLAGMTANSFNSVSLHPPIVLWSLAKKSSSMPAFLESEVFGVSVLAAHQKELALHFAQFKGDRFEGRPFIEGLHGLPLIPEALAHFECKVRNRYDEGDHVIVVGEVLRCDYQDGEALVYRVRQYFGHPAN